MEEIKDNALPVAPAIKRWGPRKPLLVGIIVIVSLVVTWHVWLADNTVPAAIRNTVPFPVYYPLQDKLPPGYRLDTASFHLAPGNAVIYRLIKSNGEDLTFSEVAQPDQSTITKFLAASIPLHNDLQTPLGKAEQGAAGSGQYLQTVVSLPISSGPWLIITAPTDTNQSELRTTLQALTK